MAFADKNADGNEDHVDDDAVPVPLTAPLMLVLFLRWGAPVKNEGVVTLIEQVQRTDLTLESTGGGYVVPRVVRLPVLEGADEDERAGVDVGRTAAENIQRGETDVRTRLHAPPRAVP